MHIFLPAHLTLAVDYEILHDGLAEACPPWQHHTIGTAVGRVVVPVVAGLRALAVAVAADTVAVREERKGESRVALIPMFVLTFFLTVGYFLANFERPVLGCIEAKRCK